MLDYLTQGCTWDAGYCGQCEEMTLMLDYVMQGSFSTHMGCRAVWVGVTSNDLCGTGLMCLLFGIQVCMDAQRGCCNCGDDV